MTRTLGHLPLEPYLRKFIAPKREYENGRLCLGKNVELPEYKNYHQPMRYFSELAHEKALPVLMHRPSKIRLYRVYLLYYSKFRTDLILHAYRDQLRGLQLKGSIEEYLSYYCIAEEEFTYDRAVKLYQRGSKHIGQYFQRAYGSLTFPA